MASLSPIADSLIAELIGDAPCGFLSSDRNGKVIYANMTLARWLGYNSGALPDPMTIQDIFTKPSALYYDAQIAPMMRLQGFAREISCQLAARDGAQTFPALMNAKIRKASAGAPARIDFVFFDATERLKFESTLRKARSEAEELAAVVKNAAVGIVRVNHEGRLKRWNAAAEAVFGNVNASFDGKAIYEILNLQESDKDWFSVAKEEIEKSGEYRLETCLDEEVFLNISVAEIVNTDDPFAQSDYSIILRNISDRVRDNERLNLMVQELNHRVKNTLAVVSGLVRQTLRGPEFAEARQKLIDRLQNVSASNDILTSNYWQKVDISEIVKQLRSQLENPERIECDGPEVLLSPNHFKGISMAFHELTTNALKYGALSNQSGKILIRWSLDGPKNHQLKVKWDEIGGPPPEAPERNGFGMTMIEKILSAEFDGKTEINFRPEGLQFRFCGNI